MPCDLITRIHDIEAAYLALRNRCAPDAAVPTSGECAVPYLLQLIQMAHALLEGDYGITETVPIPTIPSCLSESFLVGVKAWIDGMTCGGGSLDNPAVYLWFISERGTEYSIRLTYDGVATPGFPGFEDASGPVSWFNSVPVLFALNGPHIAVLTASLPTDPAEWEDLWDPAYSRWLLEVNFGDRIKYFISRSDPSDAASIAAWADIGVLATFDVVGAAVLGSMTNTWSFTLPEDSLEHG